MPRSSHGEIVMWWWFPLGLAPTFVQPPKKQDILAPLNKLAWTKNPTMIGCWAAAEQTAFMEVKNSMLKKETQLAFPDFDKPLHLYTGCVPVLSGAKCTVLWQTFVHKQLFVNKFHVEAGNMCVVFWYIMWFAMQNWSTSITPTSRRPILLRVH